MSKTTLTAAPSPNGTNKERLFVRSVLVNRRDMLALDSAAGNKERPMGSKLVRALKMRYGSPKSVLRKLGLDEGLLDPNDTDDDNETERMLLRHRGMDREDIQRLIDGHAAKSEIRGGTSGEVGGGIEREGEDDDPPLVHPASRQNEDRGRRVTYDDFKDYLIERGFSDDEIDEAMMHARDHVRRRADEKHRRVGRDVLPKNASGTNAHGGGMGGHLSGGRDKGRDEIDQIHQLSERFGPNAGIATGPDPTRDNPNRIVDHGLDARRRGARDVGGEEVDKIHELMKRFGHEAGARPDRDRDRGAMDSKRTRAPSEADRARFHKMFPNAALIGSVSEEGHGRRDPSHKNPYEVV